MSSARYFPAFSFNTSIEIQMNHVAFLETAVTFGLRTKQAWYTKGLSLLAETDSKADVQQYLDSSDERLLTCQNI